LTDHPLGQAASRADPIFEGELALEMHMPVEEMRQRMSLHELTVFWPTFFRDRREQEAKRRHKERRG
jgi:hypothetical protein